MPELQVSDFRQFFFELHENIPFPWQESLAERVCASGWPDVIDLPTASGKTACIDIALFALALRGREAPRRIFFVVDRRVVVNEAYLRMCKIRCRLMAARDSVLGTVAARLKDLSGEDEPVSVYEMRGGAFRDETWVKNPLQPTVVASTVDQVGSRLLFRGYGVSDNSWPIHAGLIGNDALIILDEAHCSRAFAQTLQSVERYRGGAWAEDPIQAPFRFVEMTATPSRNRDERFHITDADRSNEEFSKRLYASKPVRLIDEVKGRKDDFGKLADELVSQAIDLADAAGATRVAILVNRVRTAKIVFGKLKKKGLAADLVIGRMRAVDRDDLYKDKLEKLKSGTERKTEDPRTFVVSTQCLEVGADLDFDVLVSECASIDALQQRFGRLDRLGKFERARGAIVIGSWQVAPKQPDPVYGEALAKTWQWLKNVGGEKAVVEMGIQASEGRPATVAQLLGQLLPAESDAMRLRGEDAPILLPAHVDALVQTSPAPQPEPLLEAFLHGPERSVSDVQVLWRADLDEKQRDKDKWEEIVKLCPPSSRETMPVPIGTFKKWFAGEKNADDQESDLPVSGEQEEPEQQRSIRALAWWGDDSELIERVNQVRPGQTLVLPVTVNGWDELGYIPEGSPIDVGDRAAFDVRKSVSLRLHPGVVKEWPQTSALQRVREYAAQDDAELGEMEKRLHAYFLELDRGPHWPFAFLSQLGKLSRRELNAYPEQEDAYVLLARSSSGSKKNEEEVPLDEHLEHVETAAEEIAAASCGDFTEVLRTAARLHDYGKVDVRYQAWLRGGDVMAARYAPKPIAKSGNVPVGRQKSVGLPDGFRHELLSVMFAEKSADVRGDMRDLILHLIASHHGRCRPFAPVVLDTGPECVSYGDISVCAKERLENAPHRIGSGVPDRFWRMTRKYGWWGLAYLEALLRLADWKASDQENAEASE